LGVQPVAGDLTLVTDKEIGLYTKGTKESTHNNKGAQDANSNIYSHTRARDTFILRLNFVCFTALKQGHFTLLHSFPFKPPPKASFQEAYAL
jgi:hypothetical protein